MSDDFLPYSKQCIDKIDLDKVISTLKSAWITQGPAIKEFEEKVAKRVGAKYAVALSNGTTALHLAYLALGVSKGDEVITSSNSFVATSNAALYCGAKPVFADIESSTGLISVEAIKAAITDKTKVITPVDFSGCPADLDDIQSLAKEKGLRVVQDAAHSLGATYKDSVVGDCKYADITIFSFHPVKPITTGEGGMITTNDKDLYDKCCLLRSHGITKDPTILSKNPGPWYYEMTDLGFNYRMTDIQAALGITQLEKLDSFITSRQEVAKFYDEAFLAVDQINPLIIPQERTSGYHLYVLRINFEDCSITRAEMMHTLREKGIGTQVHYIPIHTQPYYQQNVCEGLILPETNRYYEMALSIPIYPFMSEHDQDRVIEAFKDCVCR
ncbi:UDP-4-amino-4,6-dideoxy-N-acetyl-beta-L-altrosamine transaminase [Candidatus Marinamargulisbacteria bacterium SCGC AAA071-K20]|nr:UDP-4-amino-4,6-dideoxy-N-acetyl-beta-L-altrosamine transaminase [Candidatus Marinamargulisbacteria bacterium SCGC AAA071-K20]